MGNGGMKFTVVLEPGEESGFVARCLELKGCWSFGDTEDEAMANIKEAIIGCLRVRLKWAMDDLGRSQPMLGQTKTIELAVTSA